MGLWRSSTTGTGCIGSISTNPTMRFILQRKLRQFLPCVPNSGGLISEGWASTWDVDARSKDARFLRALASCRVAPTGYFRAGEYSKRGHTSGHGSGKTNLRLSRRLSTRNCETHSRETFRDTLEAQNESGCHLQEV